MGVTAAFHRPLRRAAASLWLVGAVLAGTTAPFSGSRIGATSGLFFALVAGCLLVLAVGTIRRSGSVLLVSLIGSGGQLFGVVGSAWELIHPTDNAKSRELGTLGVDPTVAFTINPVFSVAASAILLWAVVRMIRNSEPDRPNPEQP